MSRTDVVTTVRAADPLDPSECDAWIDAPDTVAMLERILATPVGSEPDGIAGSPDRRRRALGIASVVAVAAGGTATAFATGILGGSAPDRVKQHLAGLDQGMPADLRYNPDVDHARAVAATHAGALYLADTPDGGYCLEVVSDTARPRGATCVTASVVAGQPLEITAPIPDSDTSVLLVGGRANDDRIIAIRATYADGTSVDVGFGLDRSWLLEVAPAQQATALTHGVRIAGIATDGHVVASSHVPALRDDDPLGTAHDKEQPIVVDTVSDGDDFTLVLAIRGRVNVRGDIRLTLHYPDGTTTAVPVATDGTYRVAIPVGRHDAFADRPGRLVVTSDGDVVATAPVASVAWWRGNNG